MTTFDNAAQPRVPAGLDGAGQFSSTHHAESPVSVSPSPVSPEDAYRASQENASAVLGQIRAVDLHRDAMELDLERASLKSISLGIKDAYPDARYLRLEEDDNRYWASGLTDADGNAVQGSDDLDEFELFGEDELSNEVHALSCTNTQWTDEVSPDDEAAAGHDIRMGTVVIDLDKAAELELAPARTGLEAAVVTEEARDVLLGAADDALSHLDDIISERSADYTEDDLADIRQRIADLQRLVGG
ncbi:hypothetical protein [Arthrobacter sp. IK3]|uniref:hypothetical protein n=1 Tax=Arthrobacter sp. IK3 TaxID=3448169 RepID=UPI003EE34343